MAETPCFFIFGTSHHLQCGTSQCRENDIKIFDAYIRDICTSKGIRIIIEEASQEGLKCYEVQSTIAANVAEELDLEHEYFDLDSQERAKLNISDYDLAMISMKLSLAREDLRVILSDPIRERYWIASILGKNIWPALFICGSNHVMNVASIMEKAIGRVVIVEQDYAPG